MRLLLILLGILFCLWLATGITTVNPGELAVIRRFGKVLEKQPEPGLHIGLPWGIDQVDRVEVSRVRSVKIGSMELEDPDSLIERTPAGEMLTGDHNVVTIQAVIYYAVDPDQVVSFVLNQDRIEPVISRAAEMVLTEWVARRPMDRVLLEGKAIRLSEGESLSVALKRQTQEILTPYQLGILIQDARVTRLNPPAEVKDAFDKVTKAETEIRTLEYQAIQEAQRKVREAEAEGFRIRQLADASYREKVLLAQTEADNFGKRLKQYQQMKISNPQYLNALWWDEISSLYTRLRNGGRLDLLDHHLGPDGLDITQMPLLPGKR